MNRVFDIVLLQRKLELQDICDIERFIDGIIQNVFKKYSVLSIEREFPFTSTFKELYIKTIEEEFEKERESIIEMVLNSAKEEDQLFETEVVLGEGLGYIRYLFPISYAKALIKQGGFNPIQIEVESLYQFSKYIEIDENYEPESKEPIIVLSYPQSSPNFFVLDGNHRVTKAHTKRTKQMEAYVLPAEAMTLLAPQRIFILLSKIHLNLSLIGLYMIGDILLTQLKEFYQPISTEKWLS